MIATVTNPIANNQEVNALEVIDTGASLGTARIYATGGNRIRSLPFPFKHVVLAAGASSVLPMRPSDFRHKEPYTLDKDASSLWQSIVQHGVVTFSQAAQATVNGVEEQFIGAI